MTAITPAPQDKALWVTLLGVLLQPLSKKLGIQLDPAQVYFILAAVVTYVIAHKAKSGAISIAQIKAAASLPPVAPPVAS